MKIVRTGKDWYVHLNETEYQALRTATRFTEQPTCGVRHKNMDIQCEVPVDRETGDHMGPHATYRIVQEIAHVWDDEEE